MWEIKVTQNSNFSPYIVNIVPGGYYTETFYENCALVNALSGFKVISNKVIEMFGVRHSRKKIPFPLIVYKLLKSTYFNFTIGPNSFKFMRHSSLLCCGKLSQCTFKKYCLDFVHIVVHVRKLTLVHVYHLRSQRSNYRTRLHLNENVGQNFKPHYEQLPIFSFLLCSTAHQLPYLKGVISLWIRVRCMIRSKW